MFPFYFYSIVLLAFLVAELIPSSRRWLKQRSGWFWFIVFALFLASTHLVVPDAAHPYRPSDFWHDMTGTPRRP